MSGVTIESVNPHNLTESDFIRLNEVSQDMWASESGLGELAQCNNCGKMLSKEAVFGHLGAEIRSLTVARIMKHLGMHSVSCTVCEGDTRLIYGPENIQKIKERVLQSIDSFLVLCRNPQGEIVGFEEGYIDSLENIFNRDLSLHYKNVGVEAISQRIDAILGYTPREMLILSSVGLLEQYQNFPNLLEMLNQFSRALPDEYMGMPGITELDRNGVTYKMSENLNEGISLGIKDSPELSAKISDIGEKYDSDLILYPDPIRVYKESFTQGVRHFLKLGKRARNPVRIQENTRESISV